MSKAWRWVEEYSCGCFQTAEAKRELPGYCPTHGNDRRNIYTEDYRKIVHVERQKP